MQQPVIVGGRYRWALFVGGFLREWFEDGDKERFKKLAFYRSWLDRSHGMRNGRPARAELVDLWRYTKSKREAV